MNRDGADHPGISVQRPTKNRAALHQRVHGHQSAFFHAAVIEGEECVLIRRELEQLDRRVFTVLLKFAHEHRMRVQADRRSAVAPVPRERRGRELPES